MSLIMTDQAFNLWMVDADIGSKLCYYEGFLAKDRGPIRPQEQTKRNIYQLILLADRAYYAAQQGWVYLYQKKITQGRYEYIAELRERPTSTTRQPVRKTTFQNYLKVKEMA